MKIKCIAFSLLMILFLFSACSAAKEKKTEFTQNEVVETNGLKVKIDNVYKSYDNNSILLEDGSTYVVVELTIQNMSKEKKTVSINDWKLQNTGGTESETEWVSKLNNEDMLVDVLANGTVSGKLYFKQKENSTGLKLAYYASIFDKTAEVTITLACNCTTAALKTEAYAKTDKVIYQDLEYSVVSTKTSKGKDYTKPSAGKIFLGVTVNAKNVSLKDQIEVTDYNWKVVDAQRGSI